MSCLLLWCAFMTDMASDHVIAQSTVDAQESHEKDQETNPIT